MKIVKHVNSTTQQQQQQQQKQTNKQKNENNKTKHIFFCQTSFISNCKLQCYGKCRKFARYLKHHDLA